jgi:formylglycine-generating enzyme required for sulfatase activity
MKSFYIGKYPVTQKQWKDVFGDNMPQLDYGVGDNYPIYNVDWRSAASFIQRLSFITGKKYFLPRSEEWEYAAKGGNKSRGYEYSGSNNVDEVAWYSENSNNSAHPVGEKLPNELGIYDMSGNVCEWTSTEYFPTENGQKTPHIYMVRSGSWKSNKQSCRVSSSGFICPYNYKEEPFGFRVILYAPK